MARVKLSEYRAKTLLVTGYTGHELRLETLAENVALLDSSTMYVLKVDQGVKKRGKQGLVRLNVSKENALETANELCEQGFTRCIAEPMVPHEEADEHYISFERTAQGILFSYSSHGGVDVEAHAEKLKTSYESKEIPLPAVFLEHVVAVMNEEHMSFVEINPLLVQEDNCILLDAAVLVDSTAEAMTHWSVDEDVVEVRKQSEAEASIAELNANSTAALSFRVLNPEGAIWLLLSGGGASITIADEAHNQGKAEYIGNYGEYSGGPTAEETYLYTKHVLSQMFQSNAPKLAFVIAGGVANFTDVKKTFTGIIQALTETLEDCRAHHVRVFVRRGGPNEKEGLALMKAFLKQNELYGSVHGSDVVLTEVIHEALEYVGV